MFQPLGNIEWIGTPQAFKLYLATRSPKYQPILSRGVHPHTNVRVSKLLRVLRKQWVPTLRVLTTNGRHSTVEVRTWSASLSIHTVNHMVEPYASFTVLIG